MYSILIKKLKNIFKKKSYKLAFFSYIYIGDAMNYETYKKSHKKKSKKIDFSFLNYINKFLFVILITVITLIALKSNSAFKTKFYKYVYEDHFSFATINKLYQKYFGTQFPFADLIDNKTKSVFNEQLTYSSKEAYKDGVNLTVQKNYLVPALEDGMVVFVGEKEGYGNTVIIQQTNGIDIWYSNISLDNLKTYDYIEKGSIIGEVKDTTLTMLFKKDGNILSYEEYI